MGHPSRAPDRSATHPVDEDDVTIVRPLPALRHSRMPIAHATITMPLVDATFRRLGTEPPGRADNDALTEDELFAIWVAHLV